MKTIQSTAMIACSFLFLSACNIQEKELGSNKKIPLEIVVKEKETRAVIAGATLPLKTSFGIFGMVGNELQKDIENVKVFYTGRCELQELVYLDSRPTKIYAYYPYNESMTLDNFPLNPKAQTDYLYGYSATDNNELATVNEDYPKANIFLKHAMARVTLNIKTAKEITEDLYVYSVGFTGVPLEGNLNILSGEVKASDEGDLIIAAELLLTTKGEKVDVLVVPTNINSNHLSLNVNEKYYTACIPQTEWRSGQQYTYEVIITQHSMTISKANITLWNNHQQDGYEVGDSNYKEN